MGNSSLYKILLVLLLGGSLISSAQTTIASQVSQGSDDAEERLSDGSVGLTSTDLEITSDGANNQLVGIRFQNINIPQGSTILSARIQFTVDETDSVSTAVTISGQDVDNAATFTTGINDLSNRVLTTVSVAWNNVPAWNTVGQAGVDQRTPDVTNIVQEIVNRVGWSSGNSLAFVINGSGERTAEAYNGDASLAPILTITANMPLDTDNDGVPDQSDLDDDNDGILDSVECSTQATGVQTATNIRHFSNEAYAQGSPGTSFAQNPLSYPGASSILLLKFPTPVPIGTAISVFLGADPAVSDSDMQVQRSDAAGNNNGFLVDAPNTFPDSMREVSFTVTDSPLEYIRVEAYQTGARVYGASYGIGCEDTDADGIANYLDLDSDGDGCNDADEAYNDPNTDSDNNGRYGSGTPTVDVDGKVVGAPYSEPVDTDNNGSYNFLEVGTTITITTQPQNQNVPHNGTATFSVSATGSNLNYQWFVSTNGDTNYTIITGGTMDTLTINDARSADAGNLYRVEIDDANNMCDKLVSNSAALNVAPEQPPVVDAIGDQNYCPGFSVPIAESISITDSDDTVTTAVYIQISSGYIDGEDLLTLTGTHPNVTDTWNATEGEISLTGPATYLEFEAAILAVEYASSAAAPTGQRQFSITVGEANYLPSTGHYYLYVDDLGITWTDANAAASASTYFGLQGYLATLTSQEEADFSGSQAAGTGWIGGSDAETEGVWKWVTGPEAGLNFWNGTAGGSSPNFAFWNTGEPNNQGDEDYAHITHPNINPNGSWNDLTNTGSASGDYQPQGYVVEYGGMPGDPTLSISDVTSITMVEQANIATQPVDQIVGDGDNATFSVTASGTSLTYQWQKSTDRGSTFTNIPGATSFSYSFSPSLGDNGNQYRVVVSDGGNVCNAAISSVAILTVKVNTVINNRRITHRVNKN